MTFERKFIAMLLFTSVVCMRAHVLFTIFVFLCVEWSVFRFCLSSSCILCTQSCQFLWIVHFLNAPSVFSNVHLFVIDVASIILFLDSIFSWLDKNWQVKNYWIHRYHRLHKKLSGINGSIVFWVCRVIKNKQNIGTFIRE